MIVMELVSELSFLGAHQNELVNSYSELLVKCLDISY